MWKCVVLALGAIAVAANGAEKWLQVELVDQGPVRGRLDPDGGLYRFYNIPYATAPTGRDKFKAPLPAPKWTEPFDAKDRNIRCPQGNVFEPEDCLVANVYVPDTTDKNLPVVVSIHGGAYQIGYGTNRVYRNFVRDNKLIMVTFNYRLAVHGFLCLGTEDVPGNAGLKDQVAALRWVNKNIANFGGNPQDVTLSACSAGGGSADMLTLSSITKGLFQRAIIGSGVSTGAVGVQIDPIENAKTYAKLLNFNDVDNMESLEEFYRTASFETLTSQSQHITNNEDVAILFSPCVEKDVGQERVITDAPMTVIKTGNYTKIPLLYGFANMEGLMRLPFYSEWKDKMNEKFSDFLPAELHFESETVKEEVAQQVKQFYFGDKPVGDETILTYIDFFTDVLFGYPMLSQLSARVESLGDTIYLYEYEFVEEKTPSILDTNVKGSGHCDQTRVIGDQLNASPEFTEMANIVRQYFVNFIKTGNPTPPGSGLGTWTPTNAKRTPHMLLGNVRQLREDILTTEDGKDRGAFWDGIYAKYYRGPVLIAADPVPGGTVSLAISKCVLFIVLLITLMFNM